MHGSPAVSHLDPLLVTGSYIALELAVDKMLRFTLLLVDLESSTPANGNAIRIPGEASQRRKAEILQWLPQS